MIIILILISLIFALLLYNFRSEKWRFWSKLSRVVIIIISVAYFTFWFVEKSISPFLENSLAVQVINRLPQPIDFYIIRIQNNDGEPYIAKHVGAIRPEYFRIEYLNMQNSDEFWVIGYLGKDKLVYFSQIAVPNKNEDKVVEVRNYINNSQKLSAIAQEIISGLKYDNIKRSVWVTLDFLLIFINIILLFRKKKNNV